MACSYCSPAPKKYGADPVSIQWKVVRGDTAILTVQFLDSDETTYFDTSGWTYKATSYDPSGQVLDDIPVTSDNGIVTIKADSCLTEKWGSGYKTIVAELPFDFQVTIPGQSVSGGGQEEDTIWTPIIGTICVLGDVTPGGSL